MKNCFEIMETKVKTDRYQENLKTLLVQICYHNKFGLIERYCISYYMNIHVSLEISTCY